MGPFSLRSDPKAELRRTLAGPASFDLEERIMLALAPRKQGTSVTVRSYDVFRDGKRDNLKVAPDHMFVEYDDGREQYIFRGGPSAHGLHAEVTRASDSRDYQRGTRVLERRFIPGATAREAIRPAQATAARIERTRPPYLGVHSNSNTAVGDATELQFGRRAGDGQTPGARPQRLYPMTQPIW